MPPPPPLAWNLTEKVLGFRTRPTKLIEENIYISSLRCVLLSGCLFTFFLRSFLMLEFYDMTLVKKRCCFSWWHQLVEHGTSFRAPAFGFRSFFAAC